jgi:ligand-binding sensor domain-containing protein/signal transduction histidine kinase
MPNAKAFIYFNRIEPSGRFERVFRKLEHMSFLIALAQRFLARVLASPRGPRLVPPWLAAPWLAACIVLLLVTWCGAAHAGAPRSLRFERIGLEDGLPQESVNAILQDRTGFMWLGTQGGLARFDGYRTRVFHNDPADPRSLVDNYIQAAYEDDAGRLWFGTRGGLVRFDAATETFVRYPLAASSERVVRNAAVTAIVGDRNGGLWIGTGDGLVHLDPDSGRLRSWRHDGRDGSSLRDDRVTALALDPHGALWVGANTGIDRLALGADRFEHFDVDPGAARGALRNGAVGGNSVLALSMGPRDTLWIGTGAGLDAWRIGEGAPQRRHVGFDEGMSATRVSRLYHDRGNNLWVGTDLEGLKWRDPVSGRFIGYANQPLDRHSLSDNQVSAIWVDRTGTLWVGTSLGGVNRTDLASGGFDRFSVLPGQGGQTAVRKVRAIAAGADGSLWLGTGGAGLMHMEPASGRVEHFRHNPHDPGSLPDDFVTALMPGRARLWIGTANGLSWRDPVSGRYTGVALGKGDLGAGAAYVQGLMLDHLGRLWIATHGGLFMLDADGRPARSWRHDPADPGSLGENYDFALLEDRQGAVWIGTENGLDRLDPASGKFAHFRHDPRDPDSLRHNRIYDLYESARGDIWVGTAGGLHRLERRKDGRMAFRMFPVHAGSEQGPIGAILEDDKGGIWASTMGGLTRVDAAGGRFKNYTAKDGLIDGTFIVGSAAAGADGELHFGGVNGMTSFLPEEVRDNPYPPTVIISDFQVLNRPRPLAGRAGAARAAELSWRDSVFTLEFAALHYADPRANRYAYRLRGFDRDWTEADAGKRFATYTNLDPGSYVFEVRAANKDGVWGTQPATLAITIAPPLWKTWWFRLGVALGALGIGAGVYRLRVRALVQQKHRLERQVGMRTAELVLQKEHAERRKQEAEAQKEAVEEARRNIALLSDIGRELTANLDGEAIMANVHAQVRQLMDADVFSIGVAVDGAAAHGARLDYRYVMRGDRRADAAGCPEPVLRLGEHCVATGEEILIDDLALEYPRYLGERLEAHLEDSAPAGTRTDTGALARADARSLLFVPIMVGAHVLGVISVQSRRTNAYRHVQLDMLSTLAAYVGVALDNADAYRRLKETQAQLAASEKLASLGSLVAGVAHELNTPIGNSLLMASTLHEKTEALAARFAGNQLKKSELEAWIAADREATSLIMRSLHAAADLVDSFRQVSVDQESRQRRRFDLARACQEIAATMMNQVRRAGHTLELRVGPGIQMDSYPGPFGQVLINFINNAMLHAFDQPGGRMALSAVELGSGLVRIQFADDGRGIPPEHLSRIFDPFFTTRMGQGGNGLGLNIAYNLVTTLLGGSIRVESSPGQGTVFILELPMRAPEGSASASAPVLPEDAL